MWWVLYDIAMCIFEFIQGLRVICQTPKVNSNWTRYFGPDNVYQTLQGLNLWHTNERAARNLPLRYSVVVEVTRLL